MNHDWLNKFRRKFQIKDLVSFDSGRDCYFVDVRYFVQRDMSPRRLTDFASTLCPPTMSRVRCFNVLTNIWMTLNNDISHDRAISPPQNKRSLAALPVCPPGVAAEWCTPEADDILAAATAAAANKRNKIEWLPCPQTGNKLGCFEQYVSMLIAAGPRQQQGQHRRRRRSTRLRPTSSAQSLCLPGVDTLQCYADLLKMFAHVTNLQDAMLVKRRENDPTPRSSPNRKGIDEKRDMPSLSQLCAPSTDSMACFERYLALYMRMNKEAGGKKNFIGRDLSNIAIGME